MMASLEIDFDLLFLPGNRPTMILYGIDKIRDLFGHKVLLGDNYEDHHLVILVLQN